MFEDSTLPPASCKPSWEEQDLDKQKRGRGRRRRRKIITSHWHLIDKSGKLTRPSMGANIIVLFFILARSIYLKGPE